MEEITTNELIQYKTGFTDGKIDIMELTRLGKVFELNNSVDNTPSIEWYDFGYKDAVEYFSEQLNKNVDIATIKVRDVVKELFSKRVIMYNLEKGKEIPISTFKINR